MCPWAVFLAATALAGNVSAARADEASDTVETMTVGDTQVPVPHNQTVGSDKLLLTGGVTQLEGAAGGGLTPWAFIGGYGTRDQVGGNAFYTHVNVGAYHLDDIGVLVGLFDRVELSLARQRFNTEDVGAALGLGRGFTFTQSIIGAKWRIAGDAVLEQDSLMPQFAVGIQLKHNDQADVLHAVGARDSRGTDFYLSATKLFLGQSILASATLRLTKANQIGLLGFGGDRHDSYQPQFEGSVAYLLDRHWAIGAEYRSKPDNLRIAHEQDWYDIFIAWAPTKHVSITLAYADLGNIVIKDNQRGLYLSAQIGF